MLSLDFFITSLVVVLIPGTGVIYTVSTAIFMGRRASIAAAIGCTGGIVPHLLGSVLGLSAILHMSAMAFQCIKYAGAVYLLYLAWSMWRETGGLQLNQNTGKKYSSGRIILRGILINILNPKLTLFFLAFLPLFVNQQGGSVLSQMLLLSAVFMFMTLVVFICYGLCAGAVRHHVMGSPKVLTMLQRTFAVAFAAFGVKLAVTEP
jgi:threonine/homoserine/homoserine lactone efflux protein